VLDDQLQGTEFSLISGIHRAIEGGADIINLSLNFDPAYVPSPAMNRALDAARAVVVASAGNEGLGQPTFPAGHPAALTVGAASDAGEALAYSNHGPFLDAHAPGGERPAADLGLPVETVSAEDPDALAEVRVVGTSYAAAIAGGARIQGDRADVVAQEGLSAEGVVGGSGLMPSGMTPFWFVRLNYVKLRAW
jgi:subtilisin family serine protease